MKSFIKVKANVKVSIKPDAKAKKSGDGTVSEKIKKTEFYVNTDNILALLKSDKDFFKVILKDETSHAIETGLGTEFIDAVVHRNDLK